MGSYMEIIEPARSRLFGALAILVTLSMVMATSATSAAGVKPGDLITPEDASMVANLVSPGNFILVRQGMRMKIVPTQRLEWASIQSRDRKILAAGAGQ